MSDMNKDILDQLVERMVTVPEALTEASVGDPQQRAMAEELELAAASAMLATLQPVREPLPEAVRERVIKDAGKYVSRSGTTVTSIESRRPVTMVDDATERKQSNWFSGLGWAAAAALLIAMLTNQSDDVTPAAAPDTTPVATAAPLEQPDAGQLRDALRKRSGSMTVQWGASDIEGYTEVTGDVVWNNDEQRGFLRLANMPVNSPTNSQYQLWIVDPSRDANPIDGGVFDIIASSNEVVIPIDAKLDVISPAAFAITREQPGGVVVSAGPLLVVAAI
ncbi:MAG: anti-sigma factor [Pseudomonadota bacterium]